MISQRRNKKEILSKRANAFFLDSGLVVLSSVLFAASFPNPIFINGIPFLAWFALVPVLTVVNKHSLPVCVLWGAFFGFTSYLLFNYWLSSFHPLAGIITYGVYSIFLAVVFLFLKLACVFFPKRFYLVQWLIWLSYEYLCTLGFMGYPYGIIGYTQWQMIPLIQIASITGIWGVSALVTFPSFYIAGMIQKEFTRRHGGTENTEEERKTFAWFVRFTVKKTDKIPALIWLTVLIASIVFGFINMKDYSGYPSTRIALIQHNTDPWEASKAPLDWQKAEAYRKDLTALKRLSDEALASNPKPQMVVWPETAIIPRIHWHYTYREIESQGMTSIIRELMDYLASKDAPFLVGNDDAHKEPAKNPDENEKFRVDYNAALLFENGKNTESYRKLRLVPFTEHFPYKKQFPFIYNWLEKADTHFWEKGENETVFKGPGFTFSAPICFEDCFGYLSRKFALKGAQVLVNLSNDAWSNSLTAQYQHLSMAVFRAVENNRPMVRSTSSGQTCAIDPNGRIIAMADPFKETYLNVTIPLVSSTHTIYTTYGDYFGAGVVILALTLLIIKALWCTMRKLKSRGMQ